MLPADGIKCAQPGVHFEAFDTTVSFKSGENKAMLKVKLFSDENSKETEDLFFRVLLE